MTNEELNTLAAEDHDKLAEMIMSEIRAQADVPMSSAQLRESQDWVSRAEAAMTAAKFLSGAFPHQLTSKSDEWSARIAVARQPAARNHARALVAGGLILLAGPAAVAVWAHSQRSIAVSRQSVILLELMAALGVALVGLGTVLLVRRTKSH